MELSGLCDDAAQAGASGVKAARVVAERLNGSVNVKNSNCRPDGFFRPGDK